MASLRFRDQRGLRTPGLVEYKTFGGGGAGEDSFKWNPGRQYCTRTKIPCQKSDSLYLWSYRKTQTNFLAHPIYIECGSHSFSYRTVLLQRKRLRAREERWPVVVYRATQRQRQSSNQVSRLAPQTNASSPTQFHSRKDIPKLIYGMFPVWCGCKAVEEEYRVQTWVIEMLFVEGLLYILSMLI